MYYFLLLLTVFFFIYRIFNIELYFSSNFQGQGRIDGAFCEHDDGDKMSWLRSVKEKGVANIEMESLGFIALCQRAGVRGNALCDDIF